MNKRASAVVAAMACGLWAATAAAAVPGTVALEGNLLTSAGGPVTDGTYAVTFSLYKDASGGAAVWSETVPKLAVSGGAFQHALGSVKALSGVDGATHKWLGVTIGNDPELARNRVNAVPYALRAGVAEGLACTGCVSVKSLKFDGDLDLGKHSIKAAGGTFTNINVTNVKSTNVNATNIDAGGVKAGGLQVTGNAEFSGIQASGTVKAKSFEGDGSKLTGIKTPAGTCSKKGEVVKGIDANGKLICVAAMDASNLPNDALDTVSNGLLSTEFTDKLSSTAAVPIKDNWPTGVSSSIVVPDLGVAKAVRVAISITNSNFTNLKTELTDPAGGKFVLFSNGKVVGGVLNATFPAPNKPVSGDLSAWHGKNAKGTWTLKVTDAHFKDNKTDGEIKAWSIEIDTLSNKKVQSHGALLATGGFGFPISTKPPFACDKANTGRAYVNDATNQMFVCLGGTWRAVALQACGNGIVEIGEACDDGTKNSDKTPNACRLTCVKAKCGDGVVDTGETCDDGNKNDSDGCKNDCSVPCNGYLYKGVCLKSASTSSNADNVPSGCNAYQPSTSWSKNDFIAICNHFSKAKGWSVNCSQIDTDSDGGLCTNFKAIASWEGPGQSSPDVWVRNPTFSFNPVGSPSSQQCKLHNYSNNIVVYACK